MKTRKYLDFLNEAAATAQTPMGSFFAEMLRLRDQAHIFHWQTASYAQHEAFGDFYENYIEQIDQLAEMIMGIKGRPQLGPSGACLILNDYSQPAIMEFIHDSECLMRDCLGDKVFISEEIRPEIQDQANLIIGEIDKLKYLLSLS